MILNGVSSGKSGGFAARRLPAMLLKEIYENYYLPMLREYDTSKRTLVEYETTISLWEKALGSLDISQVEKKHINIFKKYLSACPGLKKGTLMRSNTIRKHLRMLRPLLTTASNGTQRCKGLKILKEVPNLDPPPETFRRASDALTREEITAWIESAKSRNAPPIAGITAGLWWECLITLIYNTGIRIGSALQMKWAWVDFESRIIQIQKENGVKTTYDIYLNDEALEALNTLFRISEKKSTEDRVFAWSMNKKTFYEHAKKQQKLAGILKERQFKFHAIRKHFGSTIARENPAAAAQALGHPDLKVTTNYYMNRKQVTDPFIDNIRPLKSTATPPPPTDNKYPPTPCPLGCGVVDILMW
jgi:integrase